MFESEVESLSVQTRKKKGDKEVGVLPSLYRRGQMVATSLSLTFVYQSHSFDSFSLLVRYEQEAKMLPNRKFFLSVSHLTRLSPVFKHEISPDLKQADTGDVLEAPHLRLQIEKTLSSSSSVVWDRTKLANTFKVQLHS